MASRGSRRVSNHSQVQASQAPQAPQAQLSAPGMMAHGLQAREAAAGSSQAFFPTAGSTASVTLSKVG